MNIEAQVETVRRRLKRKHAWGFHYMEDLARDAAQQMINDLTNHKSDSYLVQFLLERGFSPEEIVHEGKRVRKLVVRHHKKIHEKEKR